MKSIINLFVVALVAVSLVGCTGGDKKEACAPFCSPVGPSPSTPTVDLKVDGSDGPHTVPSGTSATVTLASQNATSCTISPGGWTGVNGSWQTGPITAATTYTATCTGIGGTAIDTVKVGISVSTYVPATMRLVACPGGQGNICSSGSGGGNIPTGPYKAWAEITHHRQPGCSITGAISVSATTLPTTWTFGPAGQLNVANEGLATSPLAVEVVFNAASDGSAQVVASFRETCPGNNVTLLYQTMALTTQKK